MKSTIEPTEPDQVALAEEAPRSRGRPRSNRNKVLAAAAKLLKEREMSQVTMEAVAEQAGVSKVTLYRTWINRAELLSEALLGEIQDMLPLDPAGDPAHEISSHVMKFMQTLSGPLGVKLRELITEMIGTAETLVAFRDHYLGRRRSLAIGLIRRGLSSGQIRALGSAEDVHDMLYGAIFYRFLFGFDRLSADYALTLLGCVMTRPASSR